MSYNANEFAKHGAAVKLHAHRRAEVIRAIGETLSTFMLSTKDAKDQEAAAKAYDVLRPIRTHRATLMAIDRDLKLAFHRALPLSSGFHFDGQSLPTRPQLLVAVFQAIDEAERIEDERAAFAQRARKRDGSEIRKPNSVAMTEAVLGTIAALSAHQSPGQMARINAEVLVDLVDREFVHLKKRVSDAMDA